jgi:hypothetical protein
VRAKSGLQMRKALSPSTKKFRGRPVAADAERVLARAQAVTEFSRFMAGMMTQTSLGAIQGARGAKRLEHRACGAGGLREHAAAACVRPPDDALTEVPRPRGGFQATADMETRKPSKPSRGRRYDIKMVGFTLPSMVVESRG